MLKVYNETDVSGSKETLRWIVNNPEKRIKGYREDMKGHKRWEHRGKWGS